jgi:hypothetical protein
MEPEPIHLHLLLHSLENLIILLDQLCLLMDPRYLPLRQFLLLHSHILIDVFAFGPDLLKSRILLLALQIEVVVELFVHEDLFAHAVDLPHDVAVAPVGFVELFLYVGDFVGGDLELVFEVFGVVHVDVFCVAEVGVLNSC